MMAMICHLNWIFYFNSFKASDQPLVLSVDHLNILFASSMAEALPQIEAEDARIPHQNAPLINNSEQNHHPPSVGENDKDSVLDATLQRLDLFLSVLGFNQSTVLSFLASWGAFLVLGVLLPVVMLELSNCVGCEKGQIKSFEIGILLSQASLAASALLCLSHNFRKYGVRKFLFVDRYNGYVEKFSGHYVQKISDSVRLLLMWVLPCFLLKTAREIIRIMYVHHDSWWQSAAFLIAFTFSWTYVMIIVLSACILFHLVCNLQITHFDDYGKLLQRESDVVALLQEHARLRYYLSKISHRFRIYLLLQFFIVTGSQFLFLFQTTEYKVVITFINGGDFAVTSIVQVAVIIVCLNAAAKISHRAQGIGGLASRWHALVSCSSLEGVDESSSLHLDYSESDLESLDFVTAPTNVQLASYMSSCHKRLALGSMSSPPEISSSMANNESSPNVTPTPAFSTSNAEEDATNTTSNAEENNQFGPKKRQKTSKVWEEFREIDSDGVKKAECIHCKSKLSIIKSGSTTHLSRHLTGCVRRMVFQRQQRKITLQSIDEITESQSFISPALTDGKFDMVKMRESVAHWILMHEHPFTIVEEEGFNMMQRRGMCEWEKISRNTIKKDCVQVYEIEKRKLMLQLKNINKISVTTDMLSTAIKFKEVFPRFKEREPRYTCCPSNEDWEKVEKVCSILEVFNSATKIISGSEYPTSNLFLNEVYRIKVLLDKFYVDESEDPFIHDMVGAMKQKFDKYWGECNLLMSIAAVLDPRCKMRVVEFHFPKMYSEDEARENIYKVKRALYEVFEEYVAESHSEHTSQHDDIVSGSGNSSDRHSSSSSGWSEWSQFVKSVETVQPQKSELDNYLEEGCFICEESSAPFDALEWWKVNTLKYRILSKMARDILAIPISTVASEATFSAGSRVIDTYRASLSADTVQVLICGSDWCRSLHGLKRKFKGVKQPLEITLPNV